MYIYYILYIYVYILYITYICIYIISIYIYIYICVCVCECVCVCVKLKYEIFLQWNTKFSLQKVLGLLSFGPCPNCMSSANIVAEIQFKLLNERVLSTGEPCTCEYVTLLQSFHRGTLSIHWCIAQNF